MLIDPAVACKEKAFSLLFLCSLLLQSTPVAALDPKTKIRQYAVVTHALPSDADGVPIDIVQDRAGFLWIGKTNGLVRYDGIYRKYFQVADDPDLLSDSVERLHVDSDGRVIILTDRGVSVFAENSLRALAEYSDKDQHMNTVIETPTGELLFGGNTGLYRLTGGEFESILSDLEDHTVTALRWFDDALWIAANGHLWSLRGNAIREHELPSALQRQSILALEVYRSSLWLGTEAGIWRLAEEKLEPISLVAQTTSIRALQSDRDGALWFGGPDVMGRILPDDHVETVKFDGEAFGFRADVRAFLEDRDGNFWVARETGEVMGIGDSAAIRLSASEGLPLAKVNTIVTTASGTPLIGHDLGVSRMDDQTASSLVNAEQHERASRVRAVLESSEQLLWVGTDDGVAIFTANDTERTPQVLRGGITDPVFALLEQKPGLIWIGTGSGLYRWENAQLFSSEQLEDRRVETLHTGRNGQLWVGTDRGMYFLSDERFVRASTTPIPDSATVTSIASLPNGHIAAAVRDNGVLVGHGSDWRLLTVDNGFTKDSTFFLDVAPDGYLWGATISGVYRVPAWQLTDPNITELAVRTVLSTRSRYRPEMDVACCAGSNASAATMHGNRLYVSSADGVLIIDTGSPRVETATPAPYIRSKKDGDDSSWKTLRDDFIELSSDDRDLRLRYSAVQLTNGSNVRFRYRFGGEDGTWINTGRDNIASFTGLPAGKHKFEVQASVRPDEWSSSSHPLWVTRQPGFAETGYFYVLVSLCLLAAYVLLIWLRTHWLKRRVEHFEALINQRTEDLRQVNDALVQANTTLQEVSHTDALTGLHNRRYLEVNSHTLGMPDTTINEQNAYTAIVLIDIDFFKRINDEDGHIAGDAVLRQFAELLKSFVRTNDEVIRWGGEEFLLLLRYREGQLSNILERVCQSVRQHNFTAGGGKPLDLRVSTGAIACPTQTLCRYTNRLDDLFQCADMALYSVKRNGRDGWASASANDKRFRQAAASTQLADDMLDLIDTGMLNWQSSRSEIRLDADHSVVRLALLRTQKIIHQ